MEITTGTMSQRHFANSINLTNSTNTTASIAISHNGMYDSNHEVLFRCLKPFCDPQEHIGSHKLSLFTINTKIPRRTSTRRSTNFYFTRRSSIINRYQIRQSLRQQGTSGSQANRKIGTSIRTGNDVSVCTSISQVANLAVAQLVSRKPPQSHLVQSTNLDQLSAAPQSNTTAVSALEEASRCWN